MIVPSNAIYASALISEQSAFGHYSQNLKASINSIIRMTELKKKLYLNCINHLQSKHFLTKRKASAYNKNTSPIMGEAIGIWKISCLETKK